MVGNQWHVRAVGGIVNNVFYRFACAVKDIVDDGSFRLLSVAVEGVFDGRFGFGALQACIVEPSGECLDGRFVRRVVEVSDKEYGGVFEPFPLYPGQLLHLREQGLDFLVRKLRVGIHGPADMRGEKPDVLSRMRFFFKTKPGSDNGALLSEAFRCRVCGCLAQPEASVAQHIEAGLAVHHAHRLVRSTDHPATAEPPGAINEPFCPQVFRQVGRLGSPDLLKAYDIRAFLLKKRLDGGTPHRPGLSSELIIILRPVVVQEPHVERSHGNPISALLAKAQLWQHRQGK